MDNDFFTELDAILYVGDRFTLSSKGHSTRAMYKVYKVDFTHGFCYICLDIKGPQNKWAPDWCFFTLQSIVHYIESGALKMVPEIYNWDQS